MTDDRDAVEAVARGLAEHVAGDDWTAKTELGRNVYRSDARGLIGALRRAGFDVLRTAPAVAWCPVCHGYPSPGQPCGACNETGRVPA